MLKGFLNLWPAIKSVITLSDSKAFKNKSLLLRDNDINYLEKCLKIFSIFVKATTSRKIPNYILYDS